MKKAKKAPTCGVDLCWCQKSSMVTPREEPEKSIASSGRTVVSKRIDGVATRLISGVAAAFFVSLERCSCVYIDTKHDSEDAGETCTLMITEVDVGQLKNIANPLFAKELEEGNNINIEANGA